MKIRAGIELGNLTDVGCVREDNQDSYGYFEPDSDEEFKKKGRLVMVADGMGGYEGGQIASGIAVEVLRNTYRDSESDDWEVALTDAMSAAHFAIRNFVSEHPEYTGMGTTCTAAVLRDGSLFYGQVGDSRMYLMRDSHITQITRDQTVTERMVEQGIIKAEEAKNHPDYHVLTSAMGARESLEAEFPNAPIPLVAGDILLFCTDGLHDLVNDDEMLAAATAGGDAWSACKQLIALAKDRGGHDNITVQIVKVQAAQP